MLSLRLFIHNDMSKIIDNEEFCGKYISEWKPEYKNAYVITGMIQGKECIAENRVGRVAQVRLEAGDYGSHWSWCQKIRPNI